VLASITPSKTERRHLAAHTKEEPPMTTAFTHENVVKLAGVLGTAPELRLTSGGNAVATLIVYTNYTLRNDDGSRRQESDRHRVIVWGLHAEKAARLLRKGSKVRVQGRMTYPTWTDKQSGVTRYGAEIVAQTLDYQGANDEDDGGFCISPQKGALGFFRRRHDRVLG